MKPRVFLHCDVGGRPYRIEDFRSPFEELGVIKAGGALRAVKGSGRASRRLCITDVLLPDHRSAPPKPSWIVSSKLPGTRRHHFQPGGPILAILRDFIDHTGAAAKA